MKPTGRSEQQALFKVIGCKEEGGITYRHDRKGFRFAHGRLPVPSRNIDPEHPDAFYKNDRLCTPVGCKQSRSGGLPCKKPDDLQNQD